MLAAALSVAFFFSGAAGLIFQVVWFYRAGLVFGSSVWAVTIVLSSFMGGLALGNALAGRYASNVKRPLVVYAQLEALVAISGLAVSVLLPHLAVILGPLTRAAADSVWTINVIRLVAAFAVLVVPATAMGATFPVLVGAAAGDHDRFGVALGRLYGLNTLGAVVGVVTAELILVDRVGVAWAAWTAAALNVVAGALALSSLGRAKARPLQDTVQPGRPIETKKISAASASSANSASLLRLFLISAFLSGLTLLALEVVWFRFLTMYVLSTTMAASLMLAVVLAGIAVGGLIGSVWSRRASERTAAVVSLLAACAVIGSYGGFESLTSGTQVGDWRKILWFACVLTAPTSLLSGLFFTLIGNGIRRAVEHDTRAAAWLTLANTSGALVGAPLAGFVFLPLIGMESTFFLLAMFYAVIGLFIAASLGIGASMRRWPIAIGSFAAVLAFLLFPFGAMKDQYFLRAAAAYADDGSQIVATHEGRSETIFLMQQQWMGQPVYNRLVTNGFSMTGTAVPGLRYMRYFAYWPMLMHNGPIRHALLVCYGVGVTAGAVLDNPALESLDIAEISRDVVAMSDVIYAGGRHPLHDPRVQLHLEDGRYFLGSSEEKFDLITGEPPPPRTPGAVNLYTREYFELIYDRLAEGGITTYWLPVARPEPGTDVDTILRAFCDVFTDCSLWNATPFDLMMVGTKHATGPVSDEQMRAPWQTPVLQEHLREVGFERPEQIGATFVGDAAFARELVGTAPPLTDDFPHRLVPVASRPSLSAPSYAIDRAASERFQRVIDPVRARDGFISSSFIHGLWPPDMIEKSAPLFAWQRLINRNFWEGGKPLMQIEDLHAVLTQTTLRTLPLWILGSDDVKEEIAERSKTRNAETEYAHGLRALAGRDYNGAAAAFLQTEQQGLRAPTIRALLVYSLCMANQIDEARQFVRGLDVHDLQEQHFWEWMGKEFAVRPVRD
ncbi:MAG TPA: fused MFS/spermidine synthase [Vicinamibacterales bacterium]